MNAFVCADFVASGGLVGTSRNVSPLTGYASGADAGGSTIGVLTSLLQLGRVRVDCGACSARRRRNKLVGLVLDLRHWQLVLVGVIQLDVPNRAGILLHQSGHTLTAFAAKS